MILERMLDGQPLMEKYRHPKERWFCYQKKGKRKIKKKAYCGDKNF